MITQNQNEINLHDVKVSMEDITPSSRTGRFRSVFLRCSVPAKTSCWTDLEVCVLFFHFWQKRKEMETPPPPSDNTKPTLIEQIYANNERAKLLNQELFLSFDCTTNPNHLSHLSLSLSLHDRIDIRQRVDEHIDLLHRYNDIKVRRITSHQVGLTCCPACTGRWASTYGQTGWDWRTFYETNV